MSPQKIDEDGTLWFLSANDSVKNQDIKNEPVVQLLFQSSKHSGFLNVYSIAEITEDKAKIDELWQPILKVWFTVGKDDPRISVIKVSPTQGNYWDNMHGDAVAFVKWWQVPSAVKRWMIQLKVNYKNNNSIESIESKIHIIFTPDSSF